MEATKRKRRYDPEVGGSNPSPRTVMWRKFRKHFGIRWHEKLGLPECPYLHRWALNLGLVSFRVHHFLRSDDDRALHDHPWWFITFILRGAYYDVGVDGFDHLTPGSVRYRPALHRHTVVVDKLSSHARASGVWTFIITGPHLRNWGFWEGNKFRKANKWFLERGHHPCD